MRAERLTDRVAYHGEGPVWLPDHGGLTWVDMLDGDVLTLRGDRIDRRHVDSVVACVRPRTNGGLVYGIERGFALEDADGALRRIELWQDANLRMNEGAVDPEGHFYCGSMPYDRTPGAASLYRLAPDGTVTTVLPEVTVSNGLDHSPDGRLAYYNDTHEQRIDVFDHDPEAGLVNRRTLVDTGPDGRPDGLTVDAEGNIWTAMHHGSAVHCYSPEGTLEQVVELPTPLVTACTFGGDDLATLFITTSREGMAEDDDDQLAGSLFTVQPGVRGLAVRAFAG